MALDIYVGPLTLYYAGQWENIGQAEARERGIQYHIIRTRREDDAIRDPAKIRPALVDWRKSLSDALEPNITEPLDWDEGSGDYMTGRPDWDGFGPPRTPLSRTPRNTASRTCSFRLSMRADTACR